MAGPARLPATGAATPTPPADATDLATLRRTTGRTQAQVAHALGVTQAVTPRIEARNDAGTDTHLRTPVRHLDALGATNATLTATLHGHTVRIALPHPGTPEPQTPPPNENGTRPGSEARLRRYRANDAM